jgi:hypothetical protein
MCLCVALEEHQPPRPGGHGAENPLGFERRAINIEQFLPIRGERGPREVLPFSEHGLHAPRQSIYQPDVPRAREGFIKPRSLIGHRQGDHAVGADADSVGYGPAARQNH